MKTKIVFLVILCCIFSLSADKKSKQKEQELLQEQKLKELEAMKSQVETLQDSLQNLIAARYQRKQQYVTRREEDKEEMDQLRQTLERTYTELAQVREENLADMQTLEEEKKIVLQKKEDWSFVGSAFTDLLQKQADKLVEAMPLDGEDRRMDLEKVKSQYNQQKVISPAWNRFVEYRCLYIGNGRGISFKSQKLLTDNGEVQALSLIRFGNVFSYGFGANNAFYFINQTGRLGAGRYSVDRIASVKMIEYLQEAFTQWIGRKQVGGLVQFDIMQNAQSKILVSGQKTSTYKELYKEFKAGGVTMIPLLLLPLWALFLTVAKLLQFGSKKRQQRKIFREVSECLDKNDHRKALSFLKSKRMRFARIMEACLNNLTAGRSKAENDVQQILIEETHGLNKYINTLSVIAGAAPLLGLLGTISGMINLFGAVSYHGTGDPKFLAGGISEALITAKTGLFIAIIVLFIHDYLRNTKDMLQADIEKFTMSVLNRLWVKE